MVRFVRRILVLACSLLVLMPMGWCCWLLPSAQGSAKTSEAAGCSSCCSQHPKKAIPAKPTDPARSVPCPCDERVAVPVVAEEPAAPMPALPMFIEIESAHFSSAIWSQSVSWTDLPPP
jgi:hypothetical protein